MLHPSPRSLPAIRITLQERIAGVLLFVAAACSISANENGATVLTLVELGIVRKRQISAHTPLQDPTAKARHNPIWTFFIYIV